MSQCLRFVLKQVAILVGIVGAPILTAAFVFVAREYSTYSLLLGVFFAPYLFYRLVDRRRAKKYSAVLEMVAAQHLQELKRQYVILVQHDMYGRPRLKKWQSFVSVWMLREVKPVLSVSQRRHLQRSWADSMLVITRATQNALNDCPADMPFVGVGNAMEFEAYCANKLRETGWIVLQTPLSGDQGVDLIAMKDGTRVALQCKFYSSPVGNSAVQQIAAGRVHHHANVGAVITNNRYTEAAISLAASNRIHLLHHSDLAHLDRILSGQVGQASLFVA
jgi:restriction system protein